MNDQNPTRREFVATSGSAAGAAWLMRLAPVMAALQACAAEVDRSAGVFVTFTGREAADFEAFAARIVPTDDTPGATEAGVVHFADRALESVLADMLAPVRGGLAAMNERVVTAYPDAETLADLDEGAQDVIVGATEQEDPGFFFVARILVTLGLVTNPQHGGNRDGVGWELIGFPPTYSYQPPFGYYDRDEHGTPAAEGGR